MVEQRTRDETDRGGVKSILDELPVDRLREELQTALSVAAERAAERAGDKISGLTDRLTDVASGGSLTGGKGALVAGALKGGASAVKDRAKGALGGTSGDKATKATNIIEEIDVGVPVSVAYNQWTQFQDFSGFMKKVENVEQKTDEKLEFKAKILWSHRTWEATILEQVPDEKIVWRSQGEKGHVDGSVTFHELAPNLTRILVVLEYYPQGLFERVGNIWRAQGRRARLELKQFRRHVMTNVILEPAKVEGWRGEIHGGQVQADTDQEAAEDEYEEEPEEEEEEEPSDEYEDLEDEELEDEELEDEEDEGEEAEDLEDEDLEDEYDEGDEGDEDLEEDYEDEEPEDEYDEDVEDESDEADESEDEYDEAEPEDEYDEAEPEDEEYDEEEEPEDEYDEDLEDEYDEEPEDEYEDEYDEEPERPRRRAS